MSIGTTIYLQVNARIDSNNSRYLPAETSKSLGPNGLGTTQFYDRHGQLEKEISETAD
ncbi:hypothetical protein [Brevibacillus borstelensis]|uniref:hypothetical protein n=1 Tax=Brevibacillus borstelensis TaxID=45462 RepID=UPI0030C26422